MKIRVRLALLGHLSHKIDINKITRFDSDLFEILNPINYYTIENSSDGPNWSFTDFNIQQQLPERHDGDIFIAVTNVPLEGNYYARHFSNNRMCITFYEISEILKLENIPLENFVLNVIYRAIFLYRLCQNNLPVNVNVALNYVHDETRGCIFDMHGVKTDIVFSTNKPIICASCQHELALSRVQTNLIERGQIELRRIRKSNYYMILDFIQNYPILTIVFSSIFAIFLGIVGSLIASFIWEHLK